MASELPVVWIETNNDGSLVLLGRMSSFRGNFDYYRATTDSSWEDSMVEYIPARRCSSCRFFEPVPAAACSYWQGAQKADGSGFCDKWEAAT